MQPPARTPLFGARGPQVMRGYWQKDNEGVFFQNEWFRTGDIGVMGEDGYFKIVDRKKDMIKVSGFNVYPNEIENVLASHPKVLEVAAIGLPDAKSGEVIKVFIVKLVLTINYADNPIKVMQTSKHTIQFTDMRRTSRLRIITAHIENSSIQLKAKMLLTCPELISLPHITLFATRSRSVTD